jgi:prolyl-tRNA editing enzyme YbaK/EbsC (Cys-tRNA(Pro) deacylase)
MATGWPSFLLDLRRARQALGATHHLRLATERELERDFPAFDLGAMPPFATTPLPEVVDLRLLRHDRIVCAGGEHRCSVRIDALELLRITEPRVSDICEHTDEREPADRRQSF